MSAAQVTFLFADGLGRTETAPAGERLTEVAERAGLLLLMDCSAGQCGTCVAHLVSGTVVLEDYDRAVLPDSDRLDGMILTCVARTQGSCVVEFSYDSVDASADPAPAFPGRVIACEPVADEIWTLRLQVDAPFEFLPGQYVRLRPEIDAPWRSYSMANAPGESELTFYVRIVPGGAFSTWLTERARPGAIVDIDGPRGVFFLRDEPRPRLFVAGGSGLAPFLSMLKASRPGAKHGPTTLLVGARSGAHLFAAEDLRAAQAADPDLVVRRFVERGDRSDCEAGFPTAGLTAGAVDPAARVYVCGPPPMVDAAREAVERAGLSRSDLLFERFS